MGNALLDRMFDVTCRSNKFAKPVVVFLLRASRGNHDSFIIKMAHLVDSNGRTLRSLATETANGENSRRKLQNVVLDSLGDLLDAAGNKVHIFGREAGYFQVPVAEGQSGRLWQFSKSAGERILMTVITYLARNGELLLPAEVVTADASQ